MDAPVAHDTVWFYAEGEAHKGPLDLAALLDILRASPDPRLVLVWREGMSNWDRAGAQPELAPHLPVRERRGVVVPSIPAEQAEPAEPAEPAEAAGPTAREAPAAPERAGDDVRAVAMFYRRLVLLIGANVLLTFTRRGMLPAVPFGGELLFGATWVIFSAALFVLVVHTTYKLAEGIGLPVPLAWVLATMIPFVTLVVLLVISYKARTWCERHGLEMGLLGPRGVAVT
jgi:hypothetical protein